MLVEKRKFRVECEYRGVDGEIESNNVVSYERFLQIIKPRVAKIGSMHIIGVLDALQELEERKAITLPVLGLGNYTFRRTEV